jgi:hypothetical protein
MRSMVVGACNENEIANCDCQSSVHPKLDSYQ